MCKSKEKEVWKDVVGYEGQYMVSNLGRIKSLFRKGHRQENILTPCFNFQIGYLSISLYKNNKCKTFYVHRLVASAFIKNPNNKPCVNHINSNRKNNKSANLEWVTHQENAVHGFEFGNGKKGSDHGSARKIIMIKSTGRRRFKNITAAAKATEIGRTSIHNCLSGISKTSGGYRWVYA